VVSFGNALPFVASHHQVAPSLRELFRRLMEAKGIVLQIGVMVGGPGINMEGKVCLSTKNVWVALREGSDMWDGGNLGVESC